MGFRTIARELGNRRAASAVWALAMVLFAWNIWAYDLWAPDEPYFGEGAREMVVDGHWLIPHVEGVVTTDKPPLFFWLIALVSLALGGVSPWTARLPSVVAALGSVILTTRLARRWWDGSSAAVAGAVLATSVLFWLEARRAQIDAVLCLLVLVAITAFDAFRAGRSGGRAAGLLFWTSAGLATLAKGPIGAVIPLVVALGVLAWDRNLGAWRRFAPLAGPLLFATLAGGWAVVATLSSGGSYSALEALRRHVLLRAVFGMHHIRPPWYFLVHTPADLLPWTGMVIGGLLVAWRGRSAPENRLLLVWSLGTLLLFSLSTEKRDLYVLPAFPAFALLAAGLVRAVATPGRAGRPAAHRRWVTASLGVAGGALLVVGLAAPLAAQRLGTIVAVEGAAWALAAVLITAGIAIVAAALRGGPRPAFWTSVAGIGAAYLVASSLLLPALDSVKSAARFARDLAATTAGYRSAGHRVFAFGLGNVPRAIAFHSGGVYLAELPSREDLAARLAAGGPLYLAADEEAIRGISAGRDESLEVVARTRMWDRRLVLLRRREQGNGRSGGAASGAGGVTPGS